MRALYAPEATLEGSGSLVLVGHASDAQPESEGAVEGLYEDSLPAAVMERPGHAGWFTVEDGRGRIRWMTKGWPDEAWGVAPAGADGAVDAGVLLGVSATGRDPVPGGGGGAGGPGGGATADEDAAGGEDGGIDGRGAG